MTKHVSKGSSSTLTKRKSWSSSEKVTLQFPPSRTTAQELVTEFKYLGITLTRDGSMLTATEKMADNFRSAIARVYRIGDSKGMLWLFQVFALTAGLYGCQVWPTFSLTNDSSKITSTHILHLGFLKRLLGVKEGTAWYSLRAPRNKSDAHLFLLVQMHHTILVQFTLFKQSSSWESCAGWLSHCK